jgi:hypothetical protein
VGGKVGSSAAARLVVFLFLNPGASKHNAITLARRGGRVENACMQDDHRIHKVHRSNSYCGKRKRCLSCPCPHPPGPILSRIGDSEQALGLLSGLFIHNHPSSACSRGCLFITIPARPGPKRPGALSAVYS